MTPDAPPSEPHPRHTSTYRLQVHAGFSLKDAARIVPYLKRLGVEAVYLSPVTTAVPGSLHGYDVCDPERVNPELGGDEGFGILAEALHEAGMGCILDIVPNHMAADPVHNRWWRDVLQYGPTSRFAGFFDIDWRPRKVGLHGKVLLPVLGEPYGVLLGRGDLKLEAAEDGLSLRVHDSTYPINPATVPSPALRNTSWNEIAVSLNGTPGDPGSYDALHELLERQSYRLAFWRTALHEANYRRFFDVSTLLGIRMEKPEVFEKNHRLLRTLVRSGIVTGVRVDHVDGLNDPQEYLLRLRGLLESEAGTTGAYILVEKILEEDESLPRDWNVHGTTGYDFLGELERLFVNPEGLRALRLFVRDFQIAGDGGAPGAIAGKDLRYECKRLVLSLLMGSELNALADLLDHLSETHRDFRDFTRDDIRLALGETIACLRFYRTYGREGLFPKADRVALEEALDEAMRRNPHLASTLFDFILRVFLAFETSHDPSPLSRAGCRAFALRFQQIMGAAQAKGVEDTAFYRDVALLSLNEVGLWPGCDALAPRAFHDQMIRRRNTHPFAMLASSTHDTKRGEDVRARLGVLSDIPERWEQAVARLRETSSGAFIPSPEATDEAGSGPERERGDSGRLTVRDEYFLYETLLGCWPLQSGAGDDPAPADDAFVNRIREAMLKSVRESKLRTSWIHPDAAYEAALEERILFLLRGPGFGAVQQDLFPLIRYCAEHGMRDSLARVACKCAAPGIPDVYQGAEGWELSLVDPDNRRPVDFAEQEARLKALEPLLDDEETATTRGTEEPDAKRAGRRGEVLRLLDRWPDGDIKRYVTARCLRWRKRHRELFLYGEYIPVPCVRADSGASSAPSGQPAVHASRDAFEREDDRNRAHEFLAFRRDLGDESLLVCFPVRSGGSSKAASRALAGEALLKLPSDWRGATLRHVFTGARFSPRPGRDGCELNVSELLGEFPVAWLWCDSSPP